MDSEAFLANVGSLDEANFQYLLTIADAMRSSPSSITDMVSKADNQPYTLIIAPQTPFIEVICLFL
jgi:hypothetical protein